MLPERRPLRGDYRRETTSAATWLICGIAGAFVLQFAAESDLMAPAANLAGDLALSWPALAAGRFWTPMTFWLLHSTENLFHVGLVLFGLFWLGRELMEGLGPRRFLGVFAGSLLTGATLWSLLHLHSGQALIGATTGLYGLLAVYALLFPERQASFLLLFFFPVTFRVRHLAIALFAVDALALLLFDLLARPLPFAYAPSAHLGGMIAGWFYYRLLYEGDGRIERERRRIRRGLAANPTVPVRSAPQPEPLPSSGRSHPDIRAQVDRILDRINSHGLDALTPEERRILDEAKDLLSRH